MQPPLNSFQRRHRQKIRNQFLGKALFLCAFLGFSVMSYRFGEKQMAARIQVHAQDIENITREKQELSDQLVNLKAESVVTAQKITELENRYREDIPNDTVAQMIKIVRDKLATGVSAERMQLLLQAAANPRNCHGRESKRFMLSTPLNQSTDSASSFGNGAVTVSGDGANSVSPDNRPEAWFNPMQKVSMKFRLIGGRVTVAEGVLPLQHSIIDDTIEYRYTIEAAPQRGFVIVTGDVCDYPSTPITTPLPAPAATTP